MQKFSRMQNSLNKIKKPLRYVKKVKNAKWLIPGWIFYEYYNVHKKKGHTMRRSLVHGVKAEAIRLAAMASLPVPGTYELTTTGLALLKKKIEIGEVEKLNLKAFRDFTPLNKINLKRHGTIRGRPYLRIYFKDKKVYFKVFYKYR